MSVCVLCVCFCVRVRGVLKCTHDCLRCACALRGGGSGVKQEKAPGCKDRAHHRHKILLALCVLVCMHAGVCACVRYACAPME